ncbi:MAG: hypothetical protein NZL95_00365 [Chitinophagales bacterium]|nr:hypothetical protein [Chitinophagales bacterium]MDW8426993.1 hypothetical protein [Chitinophagales bacterium]
MDPSYTRNDLIRYLFQEMTAEEACQFRRWLQQHPGASEELQQLQQTLADLRRVPEGPSETSVQLILAFSRQAALEHA